MMTTTTVALCLGLLGSALSTPAPTPSGCWKQWYCTGETSDTAYYCGDTAPCSFTYVGCNSAGYSDSCTPVLGEVSGGTCADMVGPWGSEYVATKWYCYADVCVDAASVVLGMHTSHAGRNGRNKRAGGVKTDGRTSTVAHRREIARSNDRNYVLDLTGGSWSTLCKPPSTRVIVTWQVAHRSLRVSRVRSSRPRRQQQRAGRVGSSRTDPYRRGDSTSAVRALARARALRTSRARRRAAGARPCRSAARRGRCSG